jgi:hypothetical protein
MVTGVLYALGAVTASAPYCSAGDVVCGGHGVRHIDLGTARMEQLSLLFTTHFHHYWVVCRGEYCALVSWLDAPHM